MKNFTIFFITGSTQNLNWTEIMGWVL